MNVTRGTSSQSAVALQCANPIVYVVDDEASVRQALELLIRSAGWQSKDAYLTHLGQSHNLCHVMFFLPMKDPAELDANDPNSPISSTSMWFPDPDRPDSPLNKELPPLRTVPIEVPYWSDGTLAFH